ncbi:MAG: DegV family protein [Clostridia bacterium]|nr:DegV family protein [Clostridia bacterium]
MRPVKILTDSCSDLNAELLREYDIDYAKMRTVYNGEEKIASLTWSYDEMHNLYEIMRGGERITTTQVPPEEFINLFTKYLGEGYDIVYIGCSSKQSGSVNTANIIAKKLKQEYTNAEIYCIDSLNASIGEGMLAIEAAKLVKAGKQAKEITDSIVLLRKKINEFVTVHSLDTLKKAGRVTGPSAFFGNLMGVKPIIIADADGEQAAYRKVKGRINSFAEIVKLLKENIINPEEQIIYFAHADCKSEEVEQLKTMIKKDIPCKDVCVVTIGPIIGASIGPDAVGIWGFGKEVTFRIGDKK